MHSDISDLLTSLSGRTPTPRVLNHTKIHIFMQQKVGGSCCMSHITRHSLYSSQASPIRSEIRPKQTPSPFILSPLLSITPNLHSPLPLSLQSLILKWKRSLPAAVSPAAAVAAATPPSSGYVLGFGFGFRFPSSYFANRNKLTYQPWSLLSLPQIAGLNPSQQTHTELRP